MNFFFDLLIFSFNFFIFFGVEIFNISENNIISVEAAKVVSVQVGKWVSWVRSYNSVRTGFHIELAYSALVWTV